MLLIIISISICICFHIRKKYFKTETSNENPDSNLTSHRREIITATHSQSLLNRLNSTPNRTIIINVTHLELSQIRPKFTSTQNDDIDDPHPVTMRYQNKPQNLN